MNPLNTSLIWIVAILGLQQDVTDTLPRIKEVVATDKKTVVILVKPVVDKPFFEQLTAVRDSIKEQREIISNLGGDMIPKSTFEKFVISQKAQNARLKRIFLKLPADIQEQIIRLDSTEKADSLNRTLNEYPSKDSVEQNQSTTERKLEDPVIPVKRKLPNIFQRLFKWLFDRNE